MLLPQDQHRSGGKKSHKEAFSTSPELPACLSGVSLAEEGYQPSTNPLPALGQPCPAPTTVSEHCGAFGLEPFSSQQGQPCSGFLGPNCLRCLQDSSSQSRR